VAPAGLVDPVSSAKLRLHVADIKNAGSPDGGTLKAMTNTTWSETGTTWDNQPAIDGAILGSFGSVARNTWYEIDVTSAVTGNGTFSFGLTSPTRTMPSTTPGKPEPPLPSLSSPPARRHRRTRCWSAPVISPTAATPATAQPRASWTGSAARWPPSATTSTRTVLSGHNHNYERFAPVDPAGQLDTARGIRQFVAGTGGESHYLFGAIQPNSEVRNSDTFGVLKLTLKASGYDWQFVPEAGRTFTDTGSGTCH
jgi:hypothetical protein